MRFYDIALFMFVFQLIGGVMLDQLGIFGFSTGLKVSGPNIRELTRESELERAKTQIGEKEQTGVGGIDPISSFFGWFYKQINNAIWYLFEKTPIGKYIFWIPVYLSLAGIPAPYPLLIFTIVSVIQTIGLVQLITGREVER